MRSSDKSPWLDGKDVKLRVGDALHPTSGRIVDRFFVWGVLHSGICWGYEAIEMWALHGPTTKNADIPCESVNLSPKIGIWPTAAGCCQLPQENCRILSAKWSLSDPRFGENHQVTRSSSRPLDEGSVGLSCKRRSRVFSLGRIWCSQKGREKWFRNIQLSFLMCKVILAF